MASVTLVIDVGDVLITTRPNAHYARLAELAQLDPDEVAARLESVRLPDAFERGQLSIGAFTDAVREVLDRPDLPAPALEAAWNCVLGDVVTPLVTAVAQAARSHDVILASNTNPLHWQLVQQHLSQAWQPLIAVLSHETGYRKPDPRFFDAVRRRLAPDASAVFIDDKAANVVAARDHGMDGWMHENPDVTIDRIQRLLSA
jgi:FMN phosphatase YigB (HAD superfamily)